MNAPSCKACTFSYFRTDQHGHAHGQCRFLPPVLNQYQFGYSGVSTEYRTEFPRVSPDCWCGKFIEKVTVNVDPYLSGSLPTDDRR